MHRMTHMLIALLLVVTASACSDGDDAARVSELIEESCRAYDASTGGIRLGAGQPVPVAPEDRLSLIRTAVDRAEEAAELDDQWIEFSIAMTRVQDQTRREVRRQPTGIPPRPDPLVFAALGTIDPNCREFTEGNGA